VRQHSEFIQVEFVRQIKQLPFATCQHALQSGVQRVQQTVIIIAVAARTASE
jgi:hypothetical protein